MRIGGAILLGVMLLLMVVGRTSGIRFAMINKQECFSHHAPYLGDEIHVSFVVIKNYSSLWSEESDPDHQGVTLEIDGPDGEDIASIQDKTSEQYSFMVKERGLYRFCFYSNSDHHHEDVIDFDIRVSHFSFYDDEEKAKDEHFVPVIEQLNQLNSMIIKILSEQHRLGAETDRQSIVNKRMSRRAIVKLLIDSAAVIGTSVFQVCMLQRLFEHRSASMV